MIVHLSVFRNGDCECLGVNFSHSLMDGNQILCNSETNRVNNNRVNRTYPCAVVLPKSFVPYETSDKHKNTYKVLPPRMIA